MIVNLSAIKNRMQLKGLLTLVRKLILSLESEYTPSIAFFEPKEVDVLKYYTDASFLLNRICTLSGVKKSDMMAKKNKTTLRPIAWAIMASFGHRNTDICEAFGLSKKTAGMTQYYRDKLKHNMRTNPPSVFLYEGIMRVLEKDIEVFEDELD